MWLLQAKTRQLQSDNGTEAQVVEKEIWVDMPSDSKNSNPFKKPTEKKDNYYVHTFYSNLYPIVGGSGGGGGTITQQQSNWIEQDETQVTFIQNKPNQAQVDNEQLILG